MWGLLERTVATQALMAVAAELKLARKDMQSLLPVEEHAALEVFFNRTVEAAGEDCVWAVLVVMLELIAQFCLAYDSANSAACTLFLCCSTSTASVISSILV